MKFGYMIGTEIKFLYINNNIIFKCHKYNVCNYYLVYIRKTFTFDMANPYLRKKAEFKQ
jgi:hypothetical protein